VYFYSLASNSESHCVQNGSVMSAQCYVFSVVCGGGAQCDIISWGPESLVGPVSGAASQAVLVQLERH